MINRFIMVITYFALFTPAHAEEASKAPVLHGTFHEDPVTGPTFDFSDGRQARMLTSDNSVFEIDLGMSMVENTCQTSDAVQVKCHLIVPSKADVASFVWTIHPDSTKIGRPIKLGVQGGPPPNFFSNPVLSTLFTATLHTQSKPDYTGRAIRFSCNSYAWALDNPTDSVMRIAAWSAETMNFNRDTKVDENESTGSLENVELIKVEDHFLVKSIDKVFLSGTFPDTSIVGDVSNLVRREGDHYCQTSFSTESDAGRKEFLERTNEATNVYVKPFLSFKSSIYRRFYRPALQRLSNLKDKESLEVE